MNNGETNQFNNLIDFFEDAGESIKLSNDDKLTEDQCKNLIDCFENYSPEQSINYLLDEIEKKNDLVSDFEKILNQTMSAIQELSLSGFEPENKDSLLNLVSTLLLDRERGSFDGESGSLSVRMSRLIRRVLNSISKFNMFNTEMSKDIGGGERREAGNTARGASTRFSQLSMLYGYKERTWNPTYFKCTSIKCDSAFIDRGYNNDDNTYSVSQPHTGIYGLLWLLLKHLNEFENDYNAMLVKEFPHKLHRPIVNDPRWGAQDAATFGTMMTSGVASARVGDTMALSSKKFKRLLNYKDGKYIYFTIKNNDEPEHNHSPEHRRSKTMKRMKWTAGTYGLTKRGKLLEKTLKTFLYLSAGIKITDNHEEAKRFAPQYAISRYGWNIDSFDTMKGQKIGVENQFVWQAACRLDGVKLRDRRGEELENIMNDDKTGDKTSKECLLQNILYILDPSYVDPSTQIGGSGDMCGKGLGGSGMREVNASK